MHIVIVTGNPGFLYPQIVHGTLDQLLAQHGPFTLFHGAHRDTGTGELTGVDRHADGWGNATPDIEVDPFPADLATRGRWAEPVRNRKMIGDAVLRVPRESIHGLAVDPNTQGTRNCVSLMKEFHIELDIWTPSRISLHLALTRKRP